jgi:hypothetical protein
MNTISAIETVLRVVSNGEPVMRSVVHQAQSELAQLRAEVKRLEAALASQSPNDGLVELVNKWNARISDSAYHKEWDIIGDFVADLAALAASQPAPVPNKDKIIAAVLRELACGLSSCLDQRDGRLLRAEEGIRKLDAIIMGLNPPVPTKEGK